MIFPKKFKLILLKCNILITYKPLYDEVDFTTIPFYRNLFREIIYLPNDKNFDPFLLADSCIKNCKDKDVCILVPGKSFDIYGTRHGRGGGWYDRFLSKIPKTWFRIGIIDKSKFSRLKIKREIWDEPVDFIIVKNNIFWKVYETKARKLIQ
jgi:5-formyltetrahydrofolate cyclo-ligase